MSSGATELLELDPDLPPFFRVHRGLPNHPGGFLAEELRETTVVRRNPGKPGILVLLD